MASSSSSAAAAAASTSTSLCCSLQSPTAAAWRSLLPTSSSSRQSKRFWSACTTIHRGGSGSVKMPTVGRRRAALVAVAAAAVPLLSALPDLSVFQSQETSFQALAALDESSTLELIQTELRKVISKGKAPGVLRLAFHDAGTFNITKLSGGMNGSIIYELERPENAGLKRSIKVLQKVKAELDPVISVSWADLIAVAGAEAVAECDGPRIPVGLGRHDSVEPDPEGEMPEETLSASALKQSFHGKGFTTQELVVLSGAHTLGAKGFGNPNLFDNSYFRILLQKPWKAPEGMTAMIGLPTDRALSDDDECIQWIRVYAGDQGRFFEDFSTAYLKLVNTGAQWERSYM
ncbi:unnamed protein product [Sphagnum troendelagicum]|uniref:L-ascorbate peroxidase n=1 Tax=Sphagnum troendelagicum TaxID=128251 RepID=A0ABP0U1L7_9BRYO